MPNRAQGSFNVKVVPLPATEGSPLARMSIDKEFHGDLAGTSKGEMLTIGTAMKASAVYVAIEHVTGTLAGRSGSFSLHHTGIMNRGVPSLTVTVVPDSGTGELAGISGTLNIIRDAGNHAYEFDYELTAEPPATSQPAT